MVCIYIYIHMNVYIQQYTRILVYCNSACFIQYDLALKYPKKSCLGIAGIHCTHGTLHLQETKHSFVKEFHCNLINEICINLPCSPLSAVCAPRPLEQWIMLKDTAEHARLANYKSLCIDHLHTQKSVVFSIFSQHLCSPETSPHNQRNQ